LQTLASRVERIGDAGAPQALGAILDYLRDAELMAAREAIRLAQLFGLDPDSILRPGGAGRPELRALMLGEVLTRRFQSGRSLGMIRGNVELAAKLVAALHLVSPMGANIGLAQDGRNPAHKSPWVRGVPPIA
jgi:3-hydroxyisobutyrate dehydrogenase-like beta-hydroxyacid dehydrogenase